MRCMQIGNQMTNFLVKLFIKDKKNVDDMEVRAQYGSLAGIVGIICNLFLFMMKLVIGIIVNSISITADAVNNLSDAASSIVSLVGVNMAKKPADEEHPFGHGRVEYIAAMIVSFIILLVGFGLFKSSFDKIIAPEALGFSWVLFGILGVSVLLKIWLSLFNHTLGVRIHSGVLKATSVDAKNDVIVTSVTMLSLLIGKFSGIMIDGWMGLLVSAFVIYSGFNIAKDTLMPLLGGAIEKDVNDKISDIVMRFPQIMGNHDLIVHNYGPCNSMASIHVEVANDSDLQEIHDIVERIEKQVFIETGISIVIHVDPVEVKDEIVLESQRIVTEIVLQNEPDADIHDFHVIQKHDQMELIFDLVVPYSYKDTDKAILLNHITSQLFELNPNYHCAITIENSFIAK